MACGREAKPHIAEGKPFAIGKRLQGFTCRRAEARAHDLDRARRGQHLAAAGVGVIAMAMGDDGERGWRNRIDGESAGRAE